MDLTIEEITRIAQQVPGEVVVYRFDESLQRLYASEGVPALSGCSPEEFASLPNNNALDLVAESDRERVLAEIARGLKSNTDFDITYRVPNREHGFIWVHGRGHTIGTMDGKPVFIALLINASLETAPQAALIGSSTRPIYVIDKDTYEVLFMNTACESIYGGTLLTGQKCFKYKYGFDKRCPWCPVPTMAGRTARLDDRYIEKVGRWFQFDYLSIDWFGHDAVAVYAFDVTERHNEQAILRETLSREERLLGYIRTINGQGSLAGRIEQVLGNVGKHLHADRAYIFDIDGDKTNNTYEWCAEGVEPEIDNLQNIDVELMERWLAYLNDGQCVIVEDVHDLKDSKPAEYEIMSKQGITSYVEAPLLADGKLAGFIGIDNPDASAIGHSADLLLSLAYYISSTLARAADEQKLQDSQRRFELAIDGAELGVWEYDIKAHTIISPSNSFAKFGITGPIANVPDSILPMFDDSEKDKLLDFYRRIDAGEPKLTSDFWVRWQPGSARRCERVTYTVERDEEGNPSIAYGIGMNYTAQKQEEEEYEGFLGQMLAIDPGTICTYQLNLTQNTSDYVNGVDDYPEELARVETVDELASRVSSWLANADEQQRFFASMSRERLVERFDAGETDISEVYRSVMPNGKTRWIAIRIGMIKSPQSQNIIAAASATDGDDDVVRRLILQYIAEGGFDHITVIYPDDSTIRIYYYNRNEPTALTEEEKSSVLGYASVIDAATSWIHPDSTKLFRTKSEIPNIIEHLNESKAYSFEFNAVGKNGDTRRKQINYLYLADMHERILEMQRDITDTYREQQRALGAAKAEAERVRDILDTISGGIGVLHMPDPDHLMIDYVNQQLYRMLGFEPLGNDVAKVDTTSNQLANAYFNNAFVGVHPDDLERVKKTFHDNFLSNHFVIDDYRTQGANGDYIWIREEATLREVTPEYRVFYAIYQEVGEEVKLREKLEQQLEEEKVLRRQADAANEAKSNFLSNVSHDMRTPLNAVLGYAGIGQDSEDIEAMRGYLAKVEQSGKVLQQLIDDTLDLNKISTGMTVLHSAPTAACDIYDDLETAIQPAIDAKGLHFTAGFEGCPMATIETDVVRIREIFLNLLNNAVKFTPEGGSISFVAKRLSTEGDIAHDCFEVHDTGYGISPEFIPHIFEPFMQERTEETSGIEGSGLGLPIVKGLVEQMGGHIEVESRPGKGSTFRVYLDFNLVPDEQPQGREDAPSEEFDLSGVKALLVEDNAMNTEIAKMVLEDKGMEVVCAKDGRLGLEAFRNSQTGEFDVVLMDVRMPVMNGLETTRKIRALERPDSQTVPIIAMTANAYDEDVRECLAAGMDAHIAKPINPQVLYETIAKHLKKSE